MITLVTGLMKNKKSIIDLAFESKIYFNGAKKLNFANTKEVSIMSEVFKLYNSEKDPEVFENLESFIQYKIDDDPNIFIRNCLLNNRSKNLLIADWKNYNEKYFLLEMGYFPTTIRIYDFKINYLEDISTDFLIVGKEEHFEDCLKKYPQYSSYKEYNSPLIDESPYKELLND